MALGYMRRHRRWLYVFLWIVIAAFIILYIPAFEGALTGSPGETVARVGGIPITVGEFQRAYYQQRQFYERLYQGRLDAAALKRLGLEEQVFETLVSDRLVQLEAERLGLGVTDAELAQAVATAPEFQENGRYMGSEELRRRLELQGVTVPQFEESLRKDILRQKLEALVTDALAVNPEEARREFQRRTEQVKAEYVLVDAARFRPQITVGGEEVEARFQAKREAYRVPEKRVIRYVLLDQTALRAQVTVTDRELELYYQDHREEFREEEQVCASHVLVKVKPSPEAKEGHEEAAARVIADKLLERLRAGADFAELARKSSEDQGSAPGGGDLGCFPRGRMVQEFDNAAFSLDPGQTSELTRTGFGFHIIRLNSRREETIPPLGQVKERIRRILTDERAQELLNLKAEAIRNSLARGRTVEEAGREQGLAAQTSAPVARGETPDPLSSAALVARAFDLKPGETEKQTFDVPRGHAFIGLAQVLPSRLPELEEVRDKLRADLVEEKAREKARQLAEQIKARAARLGLEKAAAAEALVRKETSTLVARGQSLGDLGAGAAVDEAAFSLPEKELGGPVRVESGFAILRVIERKPFDAAAFEQQRAQITASLARERKRELFVAYLREARSRHAVIKYPEAFKKVAG